MTRDRIADELATIALAGTAAIRRSLSAGGIAALNSIRPGAAAIRSIEVEIEADCTRVVTVGFEHQAKAARLLRELLGRQRQ
jgi:hypothetical protein